MAYLSLARQLLCLEEMVLETTHTPVNHIHLLIVYKEMLFDRF